LWRRKEDGMTNGTFSNIQYKATGSNQASGSVNLDEAQGIVECFVAAVGNKDSVGDIVATGAFSKSLQRRKPRVVWGHNWNDPIGKVLEIYEVPPNDPRLPGKMKAAGVGGLYARVQFNLQSEKGREAFSNVAFFGHEQEWSIGYKTLRSHFDPKMQANILHEVELYEVSPVLHGANQLTATISVKSDEEKMHMGSVAVRVPAAEPQDYDADENLFAEGLAKPLDKDKLAGLQMELNRRAGGPVVILEATENSVVFEKPGKGKFRVSYHWTGSEYMFGKPEQMMQKPQAAPMESGPSPVPGVTAKPNEMRVNRSIPNTPMPVAMKPGPDGIVLVPLPTVTYDNGKEKMPQPVLVQEEAELAEALVRIAEKYGKFDNDGDGVWAEYEPASTNEVAKIGVKCENCALYAGGNKCKILKADVEPGGKCRFAIIPDNVVSTDAKKQYEDILDEDEIKMVEDIEAKYPGEFILGVFRNVVKKRRRRRKRFMGKKSDDDVEMFFGEDEQLSKSYYIPVEPENAFAVKSLLDPVFDYHRVETYVDKNGIVITSELSDEAADAIGNATKAAAFRLGRAIGSRLVDRPSGNFLGRALGRGRRAGGRMGIPSGDLDPRTRRDSNLDGTLFDNIPGWEQPDPTPDGPGSINNPKPSKRQLQQATPGEKPQALSSTNMRQGANLRRHSDVDPKFESSISEKEKNARIKHEAVAKDWVDSGYGWTDIPRYPTDKNKSPDYLRGRELGYNQARVKWEGKDVRKRPNNFNEKQKSSTVYSQWFDGFVSALGSYLDAWKKDGDNDEWKGVEDGASEAVRMFMPDSGPWMKEQRDNLVEMLRQNGFDANGFRLKAKPESDRLSSGKKKNRANRRMRWSEGDRQRFADGQRDRAQTIPKKRKPGPSKDEFDLGSGRPSRASRRAERARGERLSSGVSIPDMTQEDFIRIGRGDKSRNMSGVNRSGGKDFLKPMKVNNQRTDSDPWMLDGGKFRDLIRARDGEKLSDTSLAQMLNVDKADIQKLDSENGISEAVVFDLLERLGVDNPESAIQQHWGWDAYPYWYDEYEGRQLSREDFADFESMSPSQRAKESIFPSLLPGDPREPEKPSTEDAGGQVPEQPRVSKTSDALLVSDFPFSKVLSALGLQDASNKEIADKLEEITGVRPSDKVVKDFKRFGFPTVWTAELKRKGAIKNAESVFGEVGKQFDESGEKPRVWQQLREFLRDKGFDSDFRKLAKLLTGDEGDRERVKAQFGKWKGGYESSFKPNVGSLPVVSADEMRAITDRLNNEFDTSFSKEDIFPDKSIGLSSGGTRVVRKAGAPRRTEGKTGFVSPLSEYRAGETLSSGKLDDIYKQVSAQLIDMIEKADPEKWDFPWRKGAFFPRNGSTNRNYRGINAFVLAIYQEDRGYKTSNWGGFKQWKKLGGSVKKGEKGTAIFIPQIFPEKKDKDGNVIREKGVSFRVGYVFNQDQVEGLPEDFGKVDLLPEAERVQELEDAISEVGAKISNSGDRAYYRPSTDEIVIPPFENFKTKQGYYATVAHEMMHWTGHESRLNRLNMDKFGSPAYAYEELVAEIAASFFMSAFNLSPEIREDHAQYLKNWLTTLKSDPEALPKAMKDAEKALNFVIERSPKMKSLTGYKEKTDAAGEAIPDDVISVPLPSEVGSGADGIMEVSKLSSGALSSGKKPSSGSRAANRRIVKMSEVKPYDYKGEKFMPTEEQRDVADATMTGEDVVVRALAGSGKTSTLTTIARRIQEQEPEKRIVYIVFQKSNQIDAEERFRGIDNTEVRTADSIAWKSLPKSITSKMSEASTNNLINMRRSDDVARAFNIPEMRIPGYGPADKDGNPTELILDRADAARFVVRAVDNFAISADDEIGAKHFKSKQIPIEEKDVPKEFIAAAKKIWEDMRDPEGKFQTKRSYAVKLWAETNPDLGTSTGMKKNTGGNDIIFFDEAQDQNPVLSRLVREQGIQKVYVGDSNQAIFGFRGAIDELDKTEAPHDLTLTRSFRFGPEVAGVGNRFLALMGSDLRIDGAGKKGELIPDGEMLPDPDAVLTRSNAGALKAIIQQLEQGKTVGASQKFKDELTSFVKTAKWLRFGSKPDYKPKKMHPELEGFDTWQQVMEAAEDADNVRLRMLMRLIQEYSFKDLESILDRVKIVGKEGGKKISASDLAEGASGTISEGINYKVVDGRLEVFGAFPKMRAAKGELKNMRFRWDPNKSNKPWYKQLPESDAERISMFNEITARITGESSEEVDVRVQTAHSAKGMEFNNVLVYGDFPRPKENKETGEVEMPSPEEQRLAYVAVTRAMQKLDPGGLRWIYDYTEDSDEEFTAPTPKTPAKKAASKKKK
jgi:HK97 family phage prohead protease